MIDKEIANNEKIIIGINKLKENTYVLPKESVALVIILPKYCRIILNDHCSTSLVHSTPIRPKNFKLRLLPRLRTNTTGLPTSR